MNESDNMWESSPKREYQWHWGGRERSKEALAVAVAGRDDEGGRMSTVSSNSSGCSSSSSVATREENEFAEVVLEQLDSQWWSDNVVRWPSSRPGSPPGVSNGSLGLAMAMASPFRPAGGVVAPKSQAWSGERAATHPRSRATTRRLSDGDYHLRRAMDKGPIPRRRLLESEESPSLHQAMSLPITPTKLESGDQSRFCSEASALDDFSPLALPPSGPLVGVTEDEEMENELFAKMLANRPAKLTTVNLGGFSSRAPLQEHNGGGEFPIKPAAKARRRRLKGTKSLTDLEYEELRGLKDLGFEVSKDDLTPHVVRMFPGLQRQGIPPYNSPNRNPHRHSQNDNVVRQNVFSQRLPPVLWPRRPASPTPFLDPSVDMKGQLKSWASEMASIVSIEC